jgi:two-component system KDP operon response regulator KdpE
MTEPSALRILLVEDQALNRDLIHAIVLRTSQPLVRGAVLTDAHDLAQAKAAVASADFDLVLLDVQLPDGSGLELFEDLAALGDRRRPPVIALTGGVLPHQRSAALEAGCDAVLDKPFLGEDLTSLIVKLVPGDPAGD